MPSIPRELPKDEPAVEPKEETAPAPAPDTFEAKFTKLTESTDAKGIVARYLENHGRWETETHRGNNTTVEVRLLRFCGCPICTDARALLKLDD